MLSVYSDRGHNAHENPSHQLVPMSRGYFILEILVTLCIIMSSMLVLVKFGNSCIRDAAFLKQTIQALNLAKSKIEYFKSYETLNITSGKLSYQDIKTGNDSPAINPGDAVTYTRRWIVTNYPNISATTAPAYAVVDVIVSWTDTTGTNQSIELTTIIAEIDPADVGSVIG